MEALIHCTKTRSHFNLFHNLNLRLNSISYSADGWVFLRVEKVSFDPGPKFSVNLFTWKKSNFSSTKNLAKNNIKMPHASPFRSSFHSLLFFLSIWADFHVHARISPFSSYTWWRTSCPSFETWSKVNERTECISKLGIGNSFERIKRMEHHISFFPFRLSVSIVCSLGTTKRGWEMTSGAKCFLTLYVSFPFLVIFHFSAFILKREKITHRKAWAM